MPARNTRTEAAAAAASADAEEKDVKIPVEAADEATDAAQTTDDVKPEVDEAQTVEQAEREQALTEEEMIEAAIRAGEEAAENDFKLKYEQAEQKAADAQRELADAVEAKEAAEGRARDALDRMARLQADWENFRRRTAAERLAEKERAAEQLVCSLLPVIDDMERAIEHAGATDGDTQFQQFVDGVSAVHAKMLGVLEKEGVEPIDPAGEPFEPLAHQAVGRVEDKEAFDETVAQVYQKGYRMGDKVIRTAMVTVTYGGPKRPAEEE